MCPMLWYPKRMTSPNPPPSKIGCCLSNWHHWNRHQFVGPNSWCVAVGWCRAGDPLPHTPPCVPAQFCSMLFTSPFLPSCFGECKLLFERWPLIETPWPWTASVEFLDPWMSPARVLCVVTVAFCGWSGRQFTFDDGVYVLLIELRMSLSIGGILFRRSSHAKTTANFSVGGACSWVCPPLVVTMLLGVPPLLKGFGLCSCDLMWSNCRLRLFVIPILSNCSNEERVKLLMFWMEVSLHFRRNLLIHFTFVGMDIIPHFSRHLRTH